MPKKNEKLTSDNINITYDANDAGWSEGLMTGSAVETATVDFPDPGFSYSFDDIGQFDLFSEEDMRKKYPALKQAWEHYQSVLEVCKTKEQEDEN